MNPAYQENAGVLVAFHAKDGKFLWQDGPRVERGLREWLLPSTTSAPYVEGNRLHYVSAECQLRSLNTQGDIVWQLDMPALGVFPHEACNSDVLPVGDLLMVSTSNGQNEGHTRVPSRAKSDRGGQAFGQSGLARHRRGRGALHGQWSSPVAANVHGRIQYSSAEAMVGCDPTTRCPVTKPGDLTAIRKTPCRDQEFSRGAIMASPVYDDGRVFVAMGQSPGHGNGPSLIHAISPNGQGDVTESRLLWTSREVGRVVGTPVAKDGLLYVGDLGGTVHLSGRGDRRAHLEARDERGHLGKPPARRRPAGRWER